MRKTIFTKLANLLFMLVIFLAFIQRTARRADLFLPRLCSFIFSVFFLFLTIFYGFSGVSTLYAADSGVRARPGFTERATLMAEIPEKSRIIPETIQAFPARGKMAYVYEDEKGFKVCMNNNCGPYVERVARDMPVISPDGNHWAAIVQSGGKARVMLNTQMGREFDLVYAVAFSPDSMKLAYIVRQGEKFFVYVNQDRSPPFAFVDYRQGLMFSPDSEDLVYVASVDGKTGSLIKNGEPGEAYDEIKHVTFSPDGRRLAYAARKGVQWRLVENDKKSPGYRDIISVRFSPDSKHLVCVVHGDDAAFVVLNGQKSESYRYIAGNPIFSNDGKRLAYMVLEENRGNMSMRMVVDNQTGPLFDNIGLYLFSQDGKQFAYMAEIEKKGMLMHNGKAHASYEALGIPVFSPDGRRLAHPAFQNQQWFMVDNGEKGQGFDHIEPPIFCPSGERMAYIAGNVAAKPEDRFVAVVSDGHIVGKHEWADLLTFSPDGRHLAYAAAEKGEAFLVIDAQKGKERFISFLKGAPLVFTEEKTV
ncbi:MAG: hypothetical protein C4548_14265, partial [Desulfobacteraceae bacterium]